MSKNKTQLERAAGKLISAIQKEWGKEERESEAGFSEEVMDKGHDLLKAVKDNNILTVLNGLSVAQYLGKIWVHKHKNVKESISIFQALINESNKV